jgi:fatty-acyl-CoA synthase
LILLDSLGSSEAIGVASTATTAESSASTATFTLGPNAKVLADDGSEVAPGSGVVGRVALRGRTPVGYHKDPERSAATFVTINGERWSIPGDYAEVAADGTAKLLGRGSQCINTGGEKVYPEEVEAAVKDHPDVFDAVVVGVPDERWGEKVVAVVRPTQGATPTIEAIQEHCRTKLAGYKVPRELVLTDEIVRSPAGKTDYRWAKEHAASALT